MIIALLLAGCAPTVDRPGDSPPPVDSADPDGPCAEQRWYADADGDDHGDPAVTTEACDAPWAFVASADDCDDTRMDVHPGAAEACDGLDHDCDGAPGDGAADAPTWYPDHDGDGFGSSLASVRACVGPPGFVAADTDCDDTRADVSPAAVEVCDDAATDEDCDGLADDADPWVAGGEAWYVDADGDGYGAADSVPTWACEAPAGMVGVEGDCDDADPTVIPTRWFADADGDGYGGGEPLFSCAPVFGYLVEGGDCDDADATIHPGGTDTCWSTADEDCDGDNNVPGTEGCEEYYADLDGDSYAGDLATACLCHASRDYPARVTSDCDDLDARVSPGAPEVCADGLDNDCSGEETCSSADAATTWEPEAAWEFTGATLAAAGDLDGDGQDDLLLGAPSADRYLSGDGEVYVVSLGDRGVRSLADAPTQLTGAAASDYLGTALAGPCDLDGDGVGEVVTGSGSADVHASNDGAVWAWSAPVTSGDTTTADLTVSGVLPSDRAGDAVGCMGTGSLVVWSPADGDGSVAVLDGLGPGVHSTEEATAWVQGSTDVEAEFGEIVVTPGDLDGDGVDDLLLATDDGAGRARAFLGPLTGVRTASDADATLDGSTAAELDGAVTPVGDHDGDGLPDLAIGDTTAHTVAIVDTPVTAWDELSTAASTWIEGPADEEFGATVAALDLDGDGRMDLAIGAPSSSPGGRTYLVSLPGSGAGDTEAPLAVIDGAATGGDFGDTLLPVGDLDGDAREDLVVGAPRSGTTFLFLAADVLP